MMMFLSLTENAGDLGLLLGNLGVLAGIYWKVTRTVRQMAGKGEGVELTNDPLRMEKVPGLATRKDLNRVERRVERLETEFHQLERANNEALGKVYDSLNALRKDTADGLAGLTRAVGRLEGKH